MPAEMDVVMVSRFQFALTIMIHYLFLPLTTGFGTTIAYLKGMFLWKRDQSYMDAVRFGTGISSIFSSVNWH